MPIMIAIVVAAKTAPAEMSFAMPTILEYLFLNTASSANSIAEFTISVIITIAIVKSTTQIFTAPKSRSTASKSAKTAAPKWIFMQSSARKARLKPFRAFLNVLPNP
jgi:hypothetical protein